MGSEDFSYMLEEKPGAYIWLGAGESSESYIVPFMILMTSFYPLAPNTGQI